MERPLTVEELKTEHDALVKEGHYLQGKWDGLQLALDLAVDDETQKRISRRLRDTTAELHTKAAQRDDLRSEMLLRGLEW